MIGKSNGLNSISVKAKSTNEFKFKDRLKEKQNGKYVLMFF